MIKVVDVDNNVFDEETKTWGCGVTKKLARPRWRLPDKFRDKDQVYPHVASVIRSCLAGDEPWPLLMIGCPGCGKTCAALTVCDWAGDSIYVQMDDLCSYIIDVQQGRGFWRYDDCEVRSERALWKNWSDANVCVLDEIGMKGDVSDHHYGVLKKAIDNRIESGLSLIVISNLDLDRLESVYDNRIVSRLAGGTVVESKGDRRQRNV